MHELYELKEMLCKELEEYGKKGELTTGSLDVVDKLAHTIKNLGKIIEMYEESEYSGAYNMGGGLYENRGGRDGRSSYREGSYARGRGRNAKRDSMGRYSSASEDMAEQLRELMEEAPESIKQDIRRVITKVESM